MFEFDFLRPYLITDDEFQQMKAASLSTVLTPYRRNKLDLGMATFAEHALDWRGAVSFTSCSGHLPEGDRNNGRREAMWYIGFAATEEGLRHLLGLYSLLITTCVQTKPDWMSANKRPTLQFAIMGDTEDMGAHPLPRRPWASFTLSYRYKTNEQRDQWVAFFEEVVKTYMDENKLLSEYSEQQWNTLKEKAVTKDRRDTLRRILADMARMRLVITYNAVADRMGMDNQDPDDMALLQSDLDHITQVAMHGHGVPALASLVINPVDKMPLLHFWRSLGKWSANELDTRGLDDTDLSTLTKGLQEEVWEFFSGDETIMEMLERYSRQHDLK